jgi:hypothetical protein
MVEGLLFELDQSRARDAGGPATCWHGGALLALRNCGTVMYLDFEVVLSLEEWFLQ